MIHYIPEDEDKRAFPAVEASFKCDLSTQDGREYAYNALRATSIILAIQKVDSNLRSAERNYVPFYECKTEEEKQQYINSAWFVRQMMREVFDELNVSYVWEV